MKPGQYFALTIGILFLLVGVSGFISGLVQPPAGTGLALPSPDSITRSNGYKTIAAKSWLILFNDLSNQ